MSISISWRLVPSSGTRVRGTSNDWSVYRQIFGQRNLTSKDADKLAAMHAATGLGYSLWGDLVEALKTVPEGSEIEVNAYW